MKPGLSFREREMKSTAFPLRDAVGFVMMKAKPAAGSSGCAKNSGTGGPHGHPALLPFVYAVKKNFAAFGDEVFCVMIAFGKFTDMIVFGKL